MVWIPGHRGISWNEKADRMASQADERSNIIEWISGEDMINISKKEKLGDMKSCFNISQYNYGIRNMKHIGEMKQWTRNRREDVILVRLLSRTVITPEILYRYNLGPETKCLLCKVNMSLEHILLDCPQYRQPRKKIYESWNINTTSILSLKSFTEFLIANKLNCKNALKWMEGFGIS